MIILEKVVGSLCFEVKINIFISIFDVFIETLNIDRKASDWIADR